eukprot:m.122837 g.122837  ORF g.122837 m.122837 type:complete len:117 (+) comp14434_c1_seq6:1892-2242(+)
MMRNKKISGSLQRVYRPHHLLAFDNSVGGTGTCEAGFKCGVDKILKTALDMVQQCDCKLGCPGCILDPKCSEHNQVVNKQVINCESFILTMYNMHSTGRFVHPDGCQRCFDTSYET